MISYILNFVLCSGLMLGIYYLLLANESLYRFNRFYLLLSLFFSLIAPLLTVQTAYNVPAIEEAIPFTENITTYQQFDNAQAMQIKPAGIVAKQQTFVFQPYKIIAGVYILGALALLVRFVRNIYQIYRRRALCYTYEHEGIPVSLLPDDVAPHSFLNNIFIGEKEYNIGVDSKIICHERAHVEQLHSIDIIMVELLQIVCWFNPLIPLYRRAIQLNHEFLADEAVVNNFDDMPEYQQLLLVKATQTNNLNLTSNFNYLTLKKRLIMMTKTTSAKTALYKKLLVLPAVAVALLLSCDRNAKELKTTDVTLNRPAEKHAGKRTYAIKHSATPAPQQVLDEYASLLKKYDITESAPADLIALSTKNNRTSKEEWEKMTELDKVAKQKLKSISKADRTRMNALFYQMDSTQQINQFFRFVPAPKPILKNSVTAQQLARWGSSKEYLIILDTKPTPYTELAKYKPEDFDWGKVNRAVNSQGRREGFKYKVELLTKPFYTNYYNKIMENQDDHMVHHMKTGERSAWLVYL